MTQTIYAICECRNKAFKKVSFEVISAARKLADQRSLSVTAVALGDGVKAVQETLDGFGADTILVVDDPVFSSHDTDVYLQAVLEIMADDPPEIILCGGTAHGKELCARLSARLGAGMVSDCTALDGDGDEIVFTRPVFGGKLLAGVVLDTSLKIAALRPNVFDITETGIRAVVKTPQPALSEGRTRLKEEKMVDTDGGDLSEARVVVAGGRGTNGDFTAIEALAKLLDGAVAASRTVIDEGWRPHADQVGQTGVVVTPDLYIACGISGAVQHFAGMSGSKTIVAVNKDAEAPIFSKSDYGIVGDLSAVIPALINEIKGIQE